MCSKKISRFLTIYANLLFSYMSFWCNKHELTAIKFIIDH
jgi:hypothetical protein